MMVVVAIVGIMSAIAFYETRRAQSRNRVEQQVSFLRTEVERAQSLAAVAGSRLGDPNRLIIDASCGAPAGPPGIWVTFAGATMVVPFRVQYDNVTDRMTVFCRTHNFTTLTNGAGLLGGFVNAAQFGFTASGRLIFPPPVPANVYVYVQAQVTTGDVRTYGFRVLSSGVTCASVTNNVAKPCDEDLL